MKLSKMTPALAFAIFSLLCVAFPASAQNAGLPDLDGDRIPNRTDVDVDGDGILNGADRNIDGGTAKTGRFRGQVIGDTLPNDSPEELDMDSDGLADDAINETDIDGDRLLDSSRRETDIDGDGLADNAANETDIDGDAFPDGSLLENDIDGDGAVDGSREEVDIDGDGIANGLDREIDGDGVPNNLDSDVDGTGIDDSTLDILYESPGNPPSYADDALVAPTIALVSSEVRKALKLSDTDTGLRVRVQVGDGTDNEPGRFGNKVTGVWRYLSSDRIQVWAKWCYPVGDPSQLKIFVDYSYIGPISGNPEDYTNPANYDVSEENRIYAGYSDTIGDFSVTRIAASPSAFIYWLPGQPVGFFYTAPNEQATGFAPPFEALNRALGSLPNFSSSLEYLDFSGELPSSIVFPGVQPITDLLRTISETNLKWYGQLEARQIR